jgi:hypothetical protein
MKTLVKIAVVIIVLLIAAAVTLYLTVDLLAKAGIESGGTYALSVKTAVDSVSLHLFQGQVGVNTLTISNPQGWQTPHLMKAGKISVGADLGSLMGDTVQVTRFDIDGLDLNIEQKIGSSNITALTSGLQSKTPEPKDKAKEAGGKKFKVSKIVIHNVVAHIQALPMGGKAATFDVKVPEIVMDNVTQDNAGGIAIPELMRRLVPAILAAVIEKAKGILPDTDFNQLSGDIGGVTKALGEGASKLVNQMGVGKLIGGLGDVFKGGDKGADKSGAKAPGDGPAKGVGDGLQKLFGGGKDGKK